MNNTKIEWCDKTWNPITGCTKCSPGCDNCYAEKMAKRMAGRFGYPKDEPFRPCTLHDDKLKEPGKLKKPAKIFVCSMGDLFHDEVFFPLIHPVMNEIQWLEMNQQLRQHTFLMLTKRPSRMYEYFGVWCRYYPRLPRNLWLGVTVCNQKEADEKIPVLLSIPAAKHFVSIEPMLELIRLDGTWLTKRCCAGGTKGLDWVIAGSETGQNARPADLFWFHLIQQQCELFQVPFFLKQVNKHGDDVMDGRTWKEFPK
jgi:protein gp37